MKQVWTTLNRGRLAIERHPFFAWLNSDEVPLTSRFAFSPLLIDFVMGFADMNKWFLRYEDPRNRYEEAINEHTAEDATHSRFFVDNWNHLNLGDTQEWPASKGLWWMFLAQQAQVVREFGMTILQLAVRHPDPLVRFPLMEAIEICGDVFFANTAPIAQRLGDQQQVEHLYYGKFHRDRETGHLQADEGCFESAELTAEQRHQAEHAAGVIFEQFGRILDQLLSFSEWAVADHRGLQRTLEREYLAALVAPEESGDPAPQYLPRVDTRNAHDSQSPLLDLLSGRVERARGHELLGWLASAGRAPVEKLRSFMPLWGIDVVGYKDFNELVLAYPTPESEAERAINQWARQLASHGALYLQDWKALRLDSILGFRMIDVISYYFLGEHTELHRRNMARVKQHAMRHDSPQIRWWVMYALERSIEPLFEVTRPLAEAAEAELGITLNYWAHRHGLVEPRSEAGGGWSFLQQPASAAEREVVREVIRTVFDNVEAAFDLSHAIARSAVFSAPPAAPRVSAVFRRPAIDRDGLSRVAGAVR